MQISYSPSSNRMKRQAFDMGRALSGHSSVTSAVRFLFITACFPLVLFGDWLARPHGQRRRRSRVTLRHWYLFRRVVKSCRSSVCLGWPAEAHPRGGASCAGESRDASEDIHGPGSDSVLRCGPCRAGLRTGSPPTPASTKVARTIDLPEAPHSWVPGRPDGGGAWEGVRSGGQEVRCCGGAHRASAAATPTSDSGSDARARSGPGARQHARRTVATGSRPMQTLYRTERSPERSHTSEQSPAAVR